MKNKRNQEYMNDPDAETTATFLPKNDDRKKAYVEDEKATNGFVGISPDEEEEHNGFGPMVLIERAQISMLNAISAYLDKLTIVFLISLVLGYHIFLVFAIRYDMNKVSNLLGVTVFTWIVVTYFRFLKPYVFATKTFEAILQETGAKFSKLNSYKFMKGSFYILSLGVMIGYLAVDSWGRPIKFERIMGVVGMFGFTLLLCILSTKPSKINWRPVMWGYLLQFVFGVMVLRWDMGKKLFMDFADVLLALTMYYKEGADFVYGFGSTPPNICGMEPILAFDQIQTIIYFTAVMGLFYYYGIIQWILKKLAWFVQLTLGTTATESLVSCSCIYIGFVESPILIRPYLEKMTASEIHAVMSAGFACIAGSVMPIFISFGACPNYLLSAAVMSGPASLACAKLLVPETEQSHCVLVEDLEFEDTEETNILESASNGSVLGARVCIDICASLVAFIGLVAWMSGMISYFGGLVGYPELTLEFFLSYLFFPVAFMMGVTNPPEALLVGRLLGVKLVNNDFIAYSLLGKYVTAGLISSHSQMVATYALCGFSNLISAGIELAVISSLAPKKKHIVVKMLMRALLAGSVACFMGACLAGILIDEPLLCPPKGNRPDCFDLKTHQKFMDDYFRNISKATTMSAARLQVPYRTGQRGFNEF